MPMSFNAPANPFSFSDFLQMTFKGTKEERKKLKLLSRSWSKSTSSFSLGSFLLRPKNNQPKDQKKWNKLSSVSFILDENNFHKLILISISKQNIYIDSNWSKDIEQLHVMLINLNIIPNQVVYEFEVWIKWNISSFLLSSFFQSCKQKDDDDIGIKLGSTHLFSCLKRELFGKLASMTFRGGACKTGKTSTNRRLSFPVLDLFFLFLFLLLWRKKGSTSKALLA